MLKLTLNQRLMIAVLVALLPIAVFSVYQANANRLYSHQLIADRLAVSALAAASDQRVPINSARLTLNTLIQNPSVYDNDPRCVEIFKDSLRAQNALVNIIWSDPAGIPKCSVLPIPPATSFAKDEWWKRVVTERDFVLSAPFVSNISNRRVVVAAQPLVSSSGTYLGTLSAGINLAWMERELRENGNFTDKLVGIADGSGKMLMSSGPRRFQNIEIAKSFGKAATVESYDGEEWMYASAPLYENQLHVVYAEKAQPLIVPMRDQLRAGIAWPILAVVLTLIAVWVGVNKLVVRWLNEIGVLAEQFARGDYSEQRGRFRRAPPEIAELGADLHSMAEAITQRNEALDNSIKATRAMAREVNHRVKNNLQMIMSLLALQSTRVEHHEARMVIDQTRGRMAALALVHRLLYEKGEDADQGEVDMDRLFGELCQQLRSSLGVRHSVELLCHANVGNRPVDEAIPVALLVVEAVTNVYLHAFPTGQQGAVSVSISKNDDVISLQIADRGVGYDPAMTETSMGTDLIRGFVEQLSGALTIDAAPDEGVTITLTYSASRIMQMAR